MPTASGILRSGRGRWAAVSAALVLASTGLVLSPSEPSALADTAYPVLLAAGDVSECEAGPGRDERVSDIVQGIPEATVAIMGDASQGDGTPAEYAECYGEGWGRFKDRTRPAPGNHDYVYQAGGIPGAGYFDYFGANAGEPGKGYYSYDLGAWHIVAINSNCGSVGGCAAGSPQEVWLRQDLAAHPSECILSYWHHPRFSSPAARPGETQKSGFEDPKMKAIWAALYEAGADVVLNGHRAVYERFARQDNSARPDPNGIREFISGTGGASVNFFREDGLIAPNSEVRGEDLGGVLRFTLRPGGYDWRFLNENPSPTAFTDSGSDTCGTAAPPAPPTTTVTTASPPPRTTGDPVPPADTTAAASPAKPAPVATAARSGYWMVTEAGEVFAFGDARRYGRATGGRIVDLEPTPSGEGYWLVDREGRVSAFGDADPHGNLDPSRLATGETVTSLSSTLSGQGYWLFTNRGRAIPAGDAVFFGDMSPVPLNGPVLDSIVTPSGRGYYMVASDGGIFAFGDAAFSGSMGGRRLNAPVVSLVPDPDLDGYWLVATDGGVFAFDAPFRGSMGGTRLNRPVTGMVPNGNGYLMVGEDGGIFNFSDQKFFGSLGDNPPASPVVSVAAIAR